VQPRDLARTYYHAIDAGDYDALADVLAPEFVHERPDRTFDGRDRFVAFVRDDRPRTDTEHAIDELYDGAGGVAVRGRLLGSDGDELFAFVDAFEVADGALVRLTTYVANRLHPRI
jgi:ketosteroid isomerase-like protein